VRVPALSAVIVQIAATVNVISAMRAGYPLSILWSCRSAPRRSLQGRKDAEAALFIMRWISRRADLPHAAPMWRALFARQPARFPVLIAGGIGKGIVARGIQARASGAQNRLSRLIVC
jgi:hypothetical protein